MQTPHFMKELEAQSRKQQCRGTNKETKPRGAGFELWPLLGEVTEWWVLLWFSFYSPPTFFFLSRATPVVYGSSQARDRIWAAAAGLHHSHSNAGSQALSATYTVAHNNAGSLTHWARPGIKPASSWVCNHLSHNGNSQDSNFDIYKVEIETDLKEIAHLIFIYFIWYIYIYFLLCKYRWKDW